MKKLLLLFLLMFLWAQGAWASGAYVNSSNGGNYSGSTITTIPTAALSTTTGNLIAVTVSWATGATISGVTDTAGNTYVQATGAFKNQTSPYIASDIWYAKNITGNASNVATVTFTPSSTAQYLGATQVQYSGLNTSSPFEAAGTGTGVNVGSVTSSSFSPAASGNINVATCNASGGNTWTAGSGYTLRNTTNNTIEDLLPASSGSQTASISSSPIQNLVLSVASFKAATGATSSTTNMNSVKIYNANIY